jgi:hypothetical protein
MLMVSFQISNIPQTPTNDKEIELHDTIKNIIKNSMDDISFAMQTDTTLEFENYWDLYEAEFVAADEIEEVEELDEDEGEDSCTSEEYEIVNNNYKRRAVEFWKSGKKGRYSLSSVQHRFKKIKSLPQLYKWELSLQRGGTHREKLLYISEYVLNKFKDANDKNSIMHDLDLRRWALEAKEEINLPHFKAEATWILNFKRKHGIVSRKITKFVNRSSKTNQEQLQFACQEFIGSL